LQALQAKATDKLDKITEKTAGKPTKKRKTKPIGKNKVKTNVKKGTFWQRLFRNKNKIEKRNKSKKAKIKK
jgi:hypothetical protein